MRERRYTVARPVTETSEREERYRVIAPVWETQMRDTSYDVVRQIPETSEREERYRRQSPGDGNAGARRALPLCSRRLWKRPSAKKPSP